MNKIVNFPNKMQRLHQQNHQPGTLVFALNSPGAGKKSQPPCQMPAELLGWCFWGAQRWAALTARWLPSL